MAKKESQEIKPKKGLPRLMELAMTQKAPMVGGMILSALATIASFLPYLAIYFIIQEIVGAYPDFDALDVPKVLGFGGLALGGVLLNVLLYTASVALSHIAAYGTLYQCKINYVSHITKLPLGYHLKMGSGRLRKIMDDNIEHSLSHIVPPLMANAISCTLICICVMIFDWRISQIMTSKSPVRSCDDVDEQALSYAEIKALCAGNPLIREKMDLDVEVTRLKVLKSDHQSQQYRLEDRLLKHFPQEIERTKANIRGFETDIQTVAAHPLPTEKEQFVGLELRGQQFSDKAKAGEALLAACKAYHGTEPMHLGSYRGFQMELSFDSFRQEFDLTLKGAMSHRLTLGTDARGNLIRMDNALAGIPARLEKAQEQLTNLENQREAAQQELGKPFPQEAELREKSARLAELDAALNMDDSPAPARDDGDRDADSGTETRPSVLADLRSKAATLPPRKPSEQQHSEEVL